MFWLEAWPIHLFVQKCKLMGLNWKSTCLAFCLVPWLFQYSYLSHLSVREGLFLPAFSLVVLQGKRLLSFVFLFFPAWLGSVGDGSVGLCGFVVMLGFQMDFGLRNGSVEASGHHTARFLAGVSCWACKSDTRGSEGCWPAWTWRKQQPFLLKAALFIQPPSLLKVQSCHDTGDCRCLVCVFWDCPEVY